MAEKELYMTLIKVGVHASFKSVLQCSILFTVGTMTVYVPKKEAGLHFDSLGMITSLLSKKSAAKKMHKPLIEVLPGQMALLRKNNYCVTVKKLVDPVLAISVYHPLLA